MGPWMTGFVLWGWIDTEAFEWGKSDAGAKVLQQWLPQVQQHRTRSDRRARSPRRSNFWKAKKLLRPPRCEPETPQTPKSLNF
eukprot:1290534-Amphidinium_carterae.1